MVGRSVTVMLASLFACTAKAGDGKTVTREFDGATALTYVQRQVAFGPRVPNTAAHRAAGDWLAAELAARADTLIVQSWRHKTA